MTTKKTAAKTTTEDWSHPKQYTRRRGEMAERGRQDGLDFMKANAKALGLDKKKNTK
ncbi:hypothetical protein [Bifidobacterium olomucense]|uniref:Uncharacterized protein n=1 Tax=Bifidobacterium olomucense TaxID=2675324 RepID=A0A7Y0EZK3_9BIFI|nr:hypothetical protein [Bifidobacterium sp. DSM 109959]NMM99290.1 hypothetical protein [Bifidobacterium sp. DSM 109959]